MSHHQTHVVYILHFVTADFPDISDPTKLLFIVAAYDGISTKEKILACMP